MSIDNAITIALNADGEEMQRSFQISTFGLDFQAPLTFCPGPSANGNALEEWTETRFFKHILPVLSAAYTKAHMMHIDQLSVDDAQLDACFTKEESLRSLNGTRILLEDVDSFRHYRPLQKLAANIENKKLSGHFATAFAVHGAAFNVPLIPLLISYYYAECKSATWENPSFTKSLFEANIEDVARGISESLQNRQSTPTIASCA